MAIVDLDVYEKAATYCYIVAARAHERAGLGKVLAHQPEDHAKVAVGSMAAALLEAFPEDLGRFAQLYDEHVERERRREEEFALARAGHKPRRG